MNCLRYLQDLDFRKGLEKKKVAVVVVIAQVQLPLSKILGIRSVLDSGFFSLFWNICRYIMTV